MVSDILSGLLADEQCSCGTGVQEPTFYDRRTGIHQETYRQKGPSHVSFAERLGRGTICLRRAGNHTYWAESVASSLFRKPSEFFTHRERDKIT